MKEFRNW